MLQPSKKEVLTAHVNKAFKVALGICDKWECSVAEKEAIFGMPRSTLHRNTKKPLEAKLSGDQIERVSYILNIHQALRIVFSNSENIYGYMNMKNNNPYFNGQTPMDIIKTGSFGSLYEVFTRINAMRGGQW